METHGEWRVKVCRKEVPGHEASETNASQLQEAGSGNSWADEAGWARAMEAMHTKGVGTGGQAGRRPEPIHFKVGTTPAEVVVEDLGTSRGGGDSWRVEGGDLPKRGPMAGKIELEMRKRGAKVKRGSWLRSEVPIKRQAALAGAVRP